MKSFINSKTIRVNIIFILVYAVDLFLSTGYIGPEVAAFFIAVANLLLRGVTKEPITLKLKEVK